jgi:hypothetical protein
MASARMALAMAVMFLVWVDMVGEQVRENGYFSRADKTPPSPHLKPLRQKEIAHTFTGSHAQRPLTRSHMENRTSNVTNHTLLATALALTTLMLIQSSIRRPNFDEWLVLRSGWLMASHEPSNLHFLMPWTWMAGQLGSHIQSATALIATLRLMTTLAVLTTLWWALREQHRSRNQALQAYVLTLSCGAFIGHGIEFRYDAVVLWSWLAAWGLLACPTPTKFVALGALIVVLALHQTKGAFFAVSLLAVTWLSARQSCPAIWRRLLMGALIPAMAWCWLLTDQGLLLEQLAVYAQFAGLRAELGGPTWTDLMAQLQNDAWWWLLMAASAALSISRWHRDRSLHITLLLGLTPAMFMVLHPRPWPYMLAPCIPFIASLSVASLNSLTLQEPRKRLHAYGLAVACLGLAVFSVQNHLHALQASGRSDLKALDLLRAVQTPHDRVLDPSGAAYFIKPIAPDWYLDGLFRHRLAQEAWQPAPANSPELPSIVVRTYRLDWIPSFSADMVHRHYEQACHWIWFRKGDARTHILQKNCPADGEELLLNYWQTLP